MKLLVYSHDAFGLGNIQRMLTICQHLLHDVPGLSILVVSGSPALHSLRLPKGLDYIKLPCVSRSMVGKVDVRFLGTPLAETILLRSQLIQTAIAHFQPDLFLVDKKPAGLWEELMPALNLLKANYSHCKRVLMLRDILDAPEVTIQEWHSKNYYNIIEKHYDQIWIAGTPDLFDARQEYQFPSAIAEKVRFCGYIRRGLSLIPKSQVRAHLGISEDSPMVLVTAGGGGDGEHLLTTYLQGLATHPAIVCNQALQHIIVCGPEMPVMARQSLCQHAQDFAQVQILEFTPDLDSYMNAADVVVSMGGYNTICEILSLKKCAVVVPRCQPVQEQLLRTKRMAERGWLTMIHPDYLKPEYLMQAVLEQLRPVRKPLASSQYPVDLNALSRITHYLSELLSGDLYPYWSFIHQTSISQPPSCLTLSKRLVSPENFYQHHQKTTHLFPACPLGAEIA